MKCARCGHSYGGRQELCCPHNTIDTSKYYNEAAAVETKLPASVLKATSKIKAK